MTIYILKLSTGEEIMGQVEDNLLTHSGFCNIITPMTIVGIRDDDGHGMRLRDTTMLSNDGMLTIHSSAVIGFYEPSDTMVDYYKSAVSFAMKYTRMAIDEQIKMAVKDLEQSMQEEQDAAEKLTKLLLSNSRSTLQ